MFKLINSLFWLVMGEFVKVIYYWVCILEILNFEFVLWNLCGKGNLVGWSYKIDFLFFFNLNYFEYVVCGLCNVYDVLKIVIFYVNNVN